MTPPPLLSIRGLTVDIGSPGAKTAPVRVLHDIDLDVPRGGIVGIVGESGSGKTMLLRALMDILPERTSRTWSISFDGRDVTAGFGRPRLPVAMVFQDPMTSFDPLTRIGAHLVEVARRSQGVGRREGRARALDALAAVRLPRPERVFDQYPHELSGGMRQRAMVAMALLADPQLLVADEPTTALDATIQIELLALLRRLQAERDLTVLIVTHDLGVVAALCDDVVVMKDGRIVERAPAVDLFARPGHAYTRALLADAPGGRVSRDEVADA
ncbi:ABC transporter ATP-binding protein [Microbacterium sp. zg-YB36]|uniref:ABC transporter ATP-binding protein n=1 Tax=Microbacterium sp. zg-YB36 TaxID=2969407 RepID=UPI00214BA40C|nr:ABC transporter ATP-binding protein [Microbacterium sp. zg-YB36]MDL5352549.1 ABC transporter ATP-binding protein [Microbacterium sp. zg-YB36]